MPRLEIGSPEARAIVNKDKELRLQNEERLYCENCERELHIRTVACPRCHITGQLMIPALWRPSVAQAVIL